MRLSTDPMRKTLWMHTEQSIYELVVRDEDRDVWKVYLARGQWENARKHAKVRARERRTWCGIGEADPLLVMFARSQTQRQRDAVLAAEADSYFAAGRYIQSAQAYAQSSKGFEEVVLRFVEKDERDALRYFLVAKLERLKRTVRGLPILSQHVSVWTSY